MNIEEKLETVFIAQGLFSGYQYIASHYSPEIASHQIPESAKNRIFNLIKKRNLYESGSETKVQAEVSGTLTSMGISVACPVLILDGLYSVDMALHHKKVKFNFSRYSVFSIFYRLLCFCLKIDRIMRIHHFHLMDVL